MSTTTITSQLSVEVVTRSGRAAEVEFRLSNSAVEVWHRGTLTAWFDRHDVGSWLADPGPRLRGTAMEFTSPHASAVAITLFEVQEWQLSPADLAGLRDLVRIP